MSSKTKPMPSLRSDDAAEDFVASADLTSYDLSGFKPMHFEIEPMQAWRGMETQYIAATLRLVHAAGPQTGGPREGPSCGDHVVQCGA